MKIKIISFVTQFKLIIFNIHPRITIITLTINDVTYDEMFMRLTKKNNTILL